ncbi:MAG: hypothetical protein INQ03_20420 [Candidatus Heimdallarchaeota archaeon]|nr:hypothetical protein [Candidatus Heimdallarchaeota archaeon]
MTDSTMGDSQKSLFSESKLYNDFLELMRETRSKSKDAMHTGKIKTKEKVEDTKQKVNEFNLEAFLYNAKSNFNRFFNKTKNLITSSVKTTIHRTSEILEIADDFLRDKLDPFFRPETLDITEYDNIVNEVKKGKLLTLTDTIFLYALLSRKLEILLSRLLKIEITERKKLFWLIVQCKDNSIITKDQADILHDFRMNRNDILHGRTEDSTQELLILVIYLIDNLEKQYPLDSQK